MILKNYAGPRGFEPRLPAPKAGRISGLPYGPKRDKLLEVKKILDEINF